MPSLQLRTLQLRHIRRPTSLPVQTKRLLAALERVKSTKDPDLLGLLVEAAGTIYDMQVTIRRLQLQLARARRQMKKTTK